LASTTARRPPARVPDSRADDEPVVVEPYRLTPKLARRIGILSGLVLVVFAALVLRLWALQVLSGSQYVAQAQSNQFRTVRVQAPRGAILDRTGKVIVTNAAATAVELWVADLPKVYADRIAELHRLSRVTRVPLYEIAAKIKQRRAASDTLTPIVVQDDAPKAMVTYLYERAGDFRGVVMERHYIRHYPYHDLGAQILGYVGEISQSQLQALSKQGYQAGDELGEAGVESAFDSYLRGVPGAARVRVDSLGRPRSIRQLVTPTQPGHALRLTIDLGLQQTAEKALQYGIKLAQANGQWAARGGAIVAMNPQDGSILAMASSPTYDPSVYTGRVTQKQLDAQGLTPSTALAKNYPSLDRALAGTYPPGSTFKPLTAIAAMEEHILAPYAYQPCTGTYYAPEDKSHRTWHNWDPNVNQAMTLPTALAYSCDTYFYGLGNDFFLLPKDRGQPLQKWARAFGFGDPTGVDLGPTSDGLVPTIGWKQSTYSPAQDACCWQVDSLWKPGDSIQLAIGQGDLLVTPLQMTRFYAALANGGKLVTPHVVEDVENPNRTIVSTPSPAAPKPIAGLDPAAVQIVQQGLYEGTHDTFGTSYGVFGNFPIPIAGKTGTAEKVVTLPGYSGKQDQGWWCGYGPTVPQPKLVVCAVIENGGHGGTVAAPAAARIFAKFFHVHVKQAGAIHSD
jgi:penicillin-binding protein 2